MGRRFLISMFLSDLLALAMAMGFALWVVFGDFAPAEWQVPAGASLWPGITRLVISRWTPAAWKAAMASSTGGRLARQILR